MSTTKTILSTCPTCGENIKVTAEIPEVNKPNVRGNIDPIGNILVYRISSEQIKDFIIQKARQYVSDVRMTIVPRYCEKKRKNSTDPHRSYASLRIAFSENVIEKKEDLGWYGSIGENGSNVKIHASIMQNLINKYQYNRKEIEAWLKNYKTLEELEEGLGMTEAYINDLRMYSIPQRVKTDNNESWIIFAAAAENVIEDMLTDPTTNKVPGRIQIQDVYPISKEIVEFVVYVHPTQMKLRENPHVRQILLGEEKPKK
jgi:hypothetical protein